MSKYIVVGIDYGTRFTKVLFRDNNQVEGKAYVVTNPAFPDGLFPSLLSVKGEVLRPFANEGDVLAYLKMIAAYGVQKYENHPDQVLESAEITIPEELKRQKANYQELDLVGLSLSYYFGCLLAEAHRCIQARFQPTSEDRLVYQLAVPTALTMKSKEVEKFFRICLISGDVLFRTRRDTILKGLRLSEIYDVLEQEVSQNLEKVWEKYEHRCTTYPETAAAVAGFFFAQNAGDGIFITSDVGAGTVDLNIFRRNMPNERNPDPELAYYSSQVAPLGAQRVADEFEYVQPMEAEELKKRLYNEIRVLFVRALQKQPNHGQINGRRTYDSARIFLFGGGKAYPIYRETLLMGLDNGNEANFNHGGVFEPMILDLPEYDEIEKPVPSVSAGRYAVAFGLTTNPLNLAKIILPNELSDIGQNAPPQNNPWNPPAHGFNWDD